jgi:hypothetical protein
MDFWNSVGAFRETSLLQMIHVRETVHYRFNTGIVSTMPFSDVNFTR